jgi:predicted TIM-barrel fold metal-dependent hydrolase
MGSQPIAATSRFRATGAPSHPTASCTCCLDRRGFLYGLGAFAAAANLPGFASAQDKQKRNIVDVHAHLTPPQYLQDLAGTDLPPPTKNWSIAKHLDDMEQGDVAVSLLSITTPGVWTGDKEKSRKIARYTNEYAAKLTADHKGRLGQFTTLPLPDIEGSLREIEFGMDQTKSDGITLMTSYDGKYLGDKSFDPVFAELNKRKAIVYVHPTAPACCVNVVPGLADSIIEFGTDTTRAIGNYVMFGASRRFPDIRMIWSHAGGTMPFLIERFDRAEKIPPHKDFLPEGFRAEARKFFYDTAQASNPVDMTALRQIIPVSQIVYGSDFPYRTAGEQVKALEAGKVFSGDELNAIWRTNVGRFMPKYQA